MAAGSRAPHCACLGRQDRARALVNGVRSNWSAFPAHGATRARRCDLYILLDVMKAPARWGLEGIVSKRLGPRYRSGRSADWLKFRKSGCAGGEA